MYALIESGAVTKYPINLSDVRKKYPNTSFPKLGSCDLTSFGVYPVTAVAAPSYDKEAEFVSEGTPVLTDGNWTQVWIKSNLSDEVKAANAAQKVSDARAKRNVLLTNTDWRVSLATETGTTLSEEWKAYRQALRDVPAQSEFPTNITWPTEPS